MRAPALLPLIATAATAQTAQPPAPTVAIRCSVDRPFVERYANAASAAIRLRNQGDGNYSGPGLFVSRGGVDLYPERASARGPYRVSFRAGLATLLTQLCQEDVSDVVRHIASQGFANEQNLFFRHDRQDAVGSVTEIGAWRLRSWDIARTGPAIR